MAPFSFASSPDRKYHKLPFAVNRRNPSSWSTSPTTTYTKLWPSRRRSSSLRIPLANGRGSLRSNPLNGQRWRWRWWNVLAVLVFILGVAQVLALVFGGVLLHTQPSPVRVAIQLYSGIPYEHLDTTAPITLEKGTHIYHVTKEFGPATLGGMGMVVTALATAQQRTGEMRASIVMPYYSFLKGRFQTDRVVDLVVDVRDKKGRPLAMEFRVWRMMFPIDPPTPANSTQLRQYITVYLIGPGNRKPFNDAFRSRSSLHIYSPPVGLPQEWREEYFVKAAAEFLAHQASATDEEPLFGPMRPQKRVDVIHLHGATNAYVAKYIRDHEQQGQLGPQPPAIVYTMHDYIDELHYSNALNNVNKFLNRPDDQLAKYTRSNRVFMSSLGIDLADVATFVSRSMAVEIVEGRMSFYFKELVMGSILRKAEQGLFIGITNGVDFGQLSPFDNKQLANRKLAFPKSVQTLIESVISVKNDNPTHLERVWPLNASPKKYIVTYKHRAKQYLVRQKKLSKQDLERPVVLFIGRFQYNKGLGLFDEAVKHFAEHNVKFVVMGQPNNYPMDELLALQERYPDHVRIISSVKEQRKWGIYYRASADFVFVPSTAESFGLVAAEGLLFGSPVISTGAGGLKEFLIDRPARYGARHIQVKSNKRDKLSVVTSSERYNAYLFDATTLGDAIRDAVADYRRNNESNARREEFALRMMASAFSLGWDRGNQEGPVYDYQRVYQTALARRNLPALNRHEIDEEQRLLGHMYLQ